jgi:hypothetical protein
MHAVTCLCVQFMSGRCCCWPQAKLLAEVAVAADAHVANHSAGSIASAAATAAAGPRLSC